MLTALRTEPKFRLLIKDKSGQIIALSHEAVDLPTATQASIASDQNGLATNIMADTKTFRRQVRQAKQLGIMLFDAATAKPAADAEPIKVRRLPAPSPELPQLSDIERPPIPTAIEKPPGFFTRVFDALMGWLLCGKVC